MLPLLYKLKRIVLIFLLTVFCRISFLQAEETISTALGATNLPVSSSTSPELFEYQAIKVPVEKVWYEESKTNFVGLRMQASPEKYFTLKKENRTFNYFQEAAYQPQLVSIYGLPTDIGLFGLGGSVSFLNTTGENSDLIQNILVQVPLEITLHYNFSLASWDILTPWIEGAALVNLLIQQSNLSKNQVLAFGRYARASAGLQFNLNYIPYWLGLSRNPSAANQNLQIQVGYQQIFNPWQPENNVLFLSNGFVMGLALYYL